MSTITVNGDTFEIVDFFPLGYSIWNIGKNMPDGYLPLCRLSQRQPFPGGRNIETDTLKAIKIDGAQTVLAAVGRGCNTIEAMEAFVNKHADATPGTCAYTEVQLYKAALPIMRQLKR